MKAGYIWKRFGGVHWRRHPWVISLAVLLTLVAVNASLQPNFFKGSVLESNFRTFVPLLLVAIGQTYVILGGGIDLSIGFIISLVNVATVQLITLSGGSAPLVVLAMLAGLLIGAAAGLVNGVCVAWFRLQPIITTFATSAIWAGLALWIMPRPGGTVPGYYYQTYAGTVLGIPTALWIMAAVCAFCLALKRTAFYTHLLAAGGNMAGAFETGIRVARVRLLSYVLAGLFAGLATLCIVGETASGDPLLGGAFTLNSISAVVLGGSSLAGGFGGALGSVFGALVLRLTDNVIFFAQVDTVYQKLLQGIIVLFALAVGGLITRRRKHYAD
ncbi:MAG: ABC transporter permease [Kiritimatiellae bacterium]|nr:ABC transporter permease [Kiritimatiellia bacterium]